ncbi:MAG: NAD(P)H-binding protein [Verrucomicrobiota bacterium]|nr:NAD(P)H-binding protein [Verrucomicrobiota bacterium]
MRVAVTGAFGYSGQYIARRLIAGGHDVLTLTNSPFRANPFGDKVRSVPFHFDQPDLLAQSLRGVEALVNTYWVRFNHRLFTFAQAVANTRVLFDAAKRAGVRRVVHVSITNPDPRSDLPYFSGKARVEAHLQSLGLSYCILRPAVLFGREDILINNIAWMLRHFPVFGLFGSGDYQLQPIFVDDLAAAAVQKAAETQNEIIQAIGPETFTFRNLVAAISKTLGLNRPIIRVPPAIGYASTRLLGLLLRDIIITRDEIRGLMENRLCVDAPPLGQTRLTDWITQNKETLGRRYANELRRRLPPQPLVP